MKQPWFHIVCEMDGAPQVGPTIRDIQLAVCRRFPGVTMREINSPRRNANITRARQMALHLSRGLTRKSFPAIAHAFGMNHTSVMYASRNIERLALQDGGVR